MKIGIYSQPVGSCLGGVDAEASALAEGLACVHDVEVVHHKPWLTKEALVKTFDVDLRGVRLRHVECQPDPFGRSQAPWARYREARRWHAEVSAPYDLTIVLATEIPPFCHSPRGILRVIFPMFGGFNRWPWGSTGPGAAAWLRDQVRNWYHTAEWQRRMSGYQAVTAISDYSRHWARLWWGVDGAIIPPGVDGLYEEGPKSPSILSVGRFDPFKKYLEMVSAYGKLRTKAPEWSYRCAGGLDHAEYYQAVREEGERIGVRLYPNAGRGDLRKLYQQAKIFWHAAGYGDDDSARPELAEHFGITTVEAMAAGCVPIAINKAGQQEVIRHGIDGFLFDTSDELIGYTELLTRDEVRLRGMSAAARERAKAFSRQVFQRRFLELVENGPAK